MCLTGKMKSTALLPVVAVVGNAVLEQVLSLNTVYQCFRNFLHDHGEFSCKSTPALSINIRIVFRNVMHKIIAYK